MRTSAVHSQGIDETELPCRSEDPELYFAESPSDVISSPPNLRRPIFSRVGYRSR